MNNEKKEELLNALENENNESIMDYDFKTISKEKNDILQQLRLETALLKLYHKKLRFYRYIKNISDIVIGNYIRWINITDPDSIKLTNGAIVCDIIQNKDALYIQCKNRYNKFFNVDIDKTLIFQKINNQENIILSVLKYIN